MLKHLVTKVIGTRFDRELKRIQPLIDQIKQHEQGLGECSDEEIRGQTEKLRGTFIEGLDGLDEELRAKKAERHA